MRIVFMGTPDFAVPTLHATIAAGHEIAAVYTQPPRPAGRGMAERKSPVHQAADRVGLTVRTPENFKTLEEQKRQEKGQVSITNTPLSKLTAKTASDTFFSKR